MVKRSKLLTALDAHKGRDYAAEKRKLQVKAAEKRKRQKIEKASAQEGEDEKQVNDGEDGVQEDGSSDDQFESFDEEDGQNGDQAGEVKNGEQNPEDEDDDDEEDEDEESDVALSDLDPEDLEDTIPHQRMTINNTSALIAARKRISLIQSQDTKIPFHTHNSLISTLDAASTSIPDPNDDLTRELEFYRIARTATLTARTLFLKENIPFTRPSDYFAEMVKTDEHMGRIKKKMYDDAAGKKASAEAKKLRDAKKFGKQVQVAKEQERAKLKRETLDKIKDLKRKRKGNDPGKVRESDRPGRGGAHDDDIFESIAVESAPTKDRSGRERGGSNANNNFKRQKRDQKFGFGGKKRFSKSGDAISSGDLGGFSVGRMKNKSGGRGGKQRPGKSRRAAGAR
ncbi:hypothetical protein PV10_04175 [Exophiala mesophila]|uniref:rRNA-processing protein EBP2 n=1 Tax=Exophiala mesophila TaxID=212818 RepID=A0A0D1XXF9_EXOME|nr:uncharacterized protein PV10_04175 [Exophiala mesophila]KIV92916.1 hypothetical protein PV10_04175 [Exophiala mesophila]